MAAERIPLPVITDPEELHSVATAIRRHPHDRPIVAHLPTAAGYVDALSSDTTRLMGRHVRSSSEDTQPHWEECNPYLDARCPFIAKYVLRGTAILEIAELSKWLENDYSSKEYPKGSLEAHDARQRYGRFAFATAKRIYETEITAGTGLVLPQFYLWPHLVYRTVPIVPDETVGFLEFATPASTKKAREAFIAEGYGPYEDFLQAWGRRSSEHGLRDLA